MSPIVPPSGQVRDILAGGSPERRRPGPGQAARLASSEKITSATSTRPTATTGSPARATSTTSTAAHGGATRTGPSGLAVTWTAHTLSHYNARLRDYVVIHHYVDTLAFHTISGSDIIDKFGYRECPRR